MTAARFLPCHTEDVALDACNKKKGFRSHSESAIDKKQKEWTNPESNPLVLIRNYVAGMDGDMIENFTSMAGMDHVQDQICFPVPNPDYHVFHITGNPGLISYYGTFLASLSKLFNQPGNPTSINIYGESLAGFEVDPHASVLQENDSGQLVDLRGQIAATERSLHTYCSRQSQNAQSPQGVLKQQKSQVILMGHSVGAYILMEVVRRHREAQKKTPQPFDIVAGILLFPTITSIAQSPNGRRLGWLLNKPLTPLLLSSLVKALVWLLPGPLFGWLVKAVTRMPESGARVTEAFLRSISGVKQALYLARFELAEITVDAWDDDIWEATRTEDHVRLHFYFGSDDHWVANHTRDELIRTRGRGKGVSMEVDELRIPHGFCISHSELVAGKVCEVIHDIILSI